MIVVFMGRDVCCVGGVKIWLPVEGVATARSSGGALGYILCSIDLTTLDSVELGEGAALAQRPVVRP